MSHSYRHIPIIGNCSNSDKPGKAKASRKLRAAERVVLATLNFNDLESMDGLIMPILREVSNVWDFPKDGKHRMNPDGAYFRKYMRK